jgi:class 3 adenylate cyclase
VAEERVERRLAAILAADVVGYSRMMSEDEAGTLARLKALRRELFEPKIKENRGRIFKTTRSTARSTSSVPSLNATKAPPRTATSGCASE